MQWVNKMALLIMHLQHPRMPSGILPLLFFPRIQPAELANQQTVSDGLSRNLMQRLLIREATGPDLFIQRDEITPAWYLLQDSCVAMKWPHRSNVVCALDSEVRFVLLLTIPSTLARSCF